MKKCVLSLFLIAESFFAFSQKKATLQDILNIVVENNYDIKMQRSALLQAKAQLMQVEGNFDFAVGGNVAYQMQQNPVDSDNPSSDSNYAPIYSDAYLDSLKNTPGFLTENTQSQAIQSQVFLQKLFSCGLESKLSYTLSRQTQKGEYDYNAAFKNAISSGVYKEIEDGKAQNQGTVALELSLPLFKSFKNSMANNQLEQAKNLCKIMELNLNDKISNMILSTVYQIEQYQLKSENLKLMKELSSKLENRSAEIDRLVRAGNRPASDKLNFDVNVLEVKRRVINAEMDFRNTKDSFYKLLNIKETDSIDVESLDMTTLKVDIDSVKHISNEEITNFAKNHPYAISAKLQLENAELGLRNAQINKFPDVNLNFGIGITGTRYSDSIGDYVLSGFQNVKGANVSGGVSVLAKIGDKAKKGAEIQAAEEVNQKKDSYDTMINQFELAIKSSIDNLYNYKAIIDDALNVLDMQKKLYDSEQKRFNAGLITTQDLIARDNEYIQAELSYRQFYMDYFYSFLSYKYYTSNLIKIDDNISSNSNLKYSLN